MKKIIALVLVLTLSLFAFAACGGKDKGDNTPAEKTYYLSLAVEGAGDASLSYGTYEVSPHVAAVVTDADGKIVAVRFDCAQTQFNFEDGALVAIDRVTTKVELKEAYGEMPAGTWYVQAQAFENFVKGMTKADIEALDVTTVTGCTMKGTNPVFKALILEALNYERKVEFKTTETNITLGVAIDANLAATEDGAQFNANYGAIAFAGDKVAAAMLDETQTTLAIADGEVSVTAFEGTKNEQGDSYVMPAGTWYKQAQGYCTTAVGKTLAELANLDAVKTDALVAAGCTMKNVAGYYAVLNNAGKYAR